MKLVPHLTAARFEQLKPGELFIALEGDRTCLALTAQDPEKDNAKLIVLLGPKFPEGIKGPHVVGWAAISVVSFGADYELRLPLEPASWSDAEPGPSMSCALLADGAPFFRANFSPTENQVRACYVKAADGTIFYRRPPGIHAFALSYEIAVAKPEQGSTIILRSGGRVA
jgi:hypothetical protein